MGCGDSVSVSHVDNKRLVSEPASKPACGNWLRVVPSLSTCCPVLFKTSYAIIPPQIIKKYGWVFLCVIITGLKSDIWMLSPDGRDPGSIPARGPFAECPPLSLPYLTN